MNNQMTVKLAASSALLALVTVGCKPTAMAERPMTASSRAPQKQASALFDKAKQAAAKRDYAAALPLAEEAVALSPRDVAYRMVLADLYVKNGRFASGETAYSDVLTLNPDNVRASLSLALAQIAQGRKSAALATLDGVVATAPASDVGLAYALAGEPRRALSILEPAARADGADGRVRQNLALAYALSGDWQKARVTAAQDISPADVGARMQQWSAFAQPASSYDQVASLLGVHPAADPGQPVRLALSNSALDEPVQAAAAEPAPAPAPEAVQIAAAPAPAPVEVAQAAPAAIEATPAPAPAVEPEVAVQYAAAAETLVKPEPAIIAVPAAAPIKALVPAFERPRAKKPLVRLAVAQAPVKVKSGRFVVQLGAYSNQRSIDRAWQQAQVRYGLGGDERALTTTIDLPGRGTLHRLSVAGFETRGDATRLCSTIRAKGGACFVRATAGDAPVQWAALRGKNNRG